MSVMATGQANPDAPPERRPGTAYQSPSAPRRWFADPFPSMVGLMLLGCGADPAFSTAEVLGSVMTFEVPAGGTEACIAVEHVPGGSYTEQDAAEERALCAIDFHDGSHGLCPKVFSTSPGTLVYSLSGGAYIGDAALFEAQACAESGLRKPGAAGDPVSFKMTMNAEGTSATYANASIAYYHLSRYLGATAHVPPAVLRTIDRQEHLRRVTIPGRTQSAGRANLRMNHTAWQVLEAAEQQPSSYRPSSDLFTAEGQIYGVMLSPLGRRYGPEVNGTRASGWGDGQSRDFQETAPFRALRSDRPLDEAIEDGLAAAAAGDRVLRDATAGTSAGQIVFWMSDIVDITLLDFIFSQQDRIGNIDYLGYWFWQEDGRLRRRRADSERIPADLKALKPVYLKRTVLGDNDAGVRLAYANFTKRTGMLENLRHYRASVYERLMRLERDLRARGPLYDYFRTRLGLSEREFEQFVINTGLAAEILRKSCKAGRLRFDVEPEEFLLTGTVVPKEVSCEAH